MVSQGDSNFLGLETSLSKKKKAETSRLNKGKGQDRRNVGTSLPPVKLLRQQFPSQNQFQNQPFSYPNQYSNQPFPYPNQYSNQQFPYPNQYSNQQFSPQNQFQNQQFSYPNQYSNQQFPPQNQFQNQQFPYPNQYSNQQFPSQNQYSNQQFPFPNQYSNQQFPYQNQFSNQQLLSPTTHRSTHSSESPHINDEVEVEVVKVTKEVRLFTKAEDICLARAYVRGTADPTICWNEIKLHYNELAAAKGLNPRKTKSLKNRMTRMKGEMVMYNEAIAHVESTYHSKWNEAMKMTKVNKKFEQLNKKFKNASFKFQHVVDILNQCSNFNYVTTRSNTPRYEGTNSSPSNNSRGTPNIGLHASTEQRREYHSGDKRSRCIVEASEKVSSPTHSFHPIGNKVTKKAAKLQANRGKGKVGEASNQSLNVLSDSSDERTIYYQEKLSQMKQAHAEKIKVLQEAVDNEKRKFELERDMRIMSIDVNSLASEVEKEQILNLRSKILSKWKE